MLTAHRNDTHEFHNCHNYDFFALKLISGINSACLCIAWSPKSLIFVKYVLRFFICFQNTAHCHELASGNQKIVASVRTVCSASSPCNHWLISPEALCGFTSCESAPIAWSRRQDTILRERSTRVGIMDKNLDYFLPSVCTQDSKKRLQVHTELANYLRDSETSIYCDDLDQFVEGLVSWVTSSNYKVSRTCFILQVQQALDVQ